jgi:hypothetical protein
MSDFGICIVQARSEQFAKSRVSNEFRTEVTNIRARTADVEGRIWQVIYQTMWYRRKVAALSCTLDRLAAMRKQFYLPLCSSLRLLLPDARDVRIIPAPSKTSVAGSGTLVLSGASSGGGAARSATNDAVFSLPTLAGLVLRRDSCTPSRRLNRVTFHPVLANSVLPTRSPLLTAQH